MQPQNCLCDCFFFYRICLNIRRFLLSLSLTNPWLNVTSVTDIYQSLKFNGLNRYCSVNLVSFDGATNCILDYEVILYWSLFLWVFCFGFIITEQKSTLCPEDGFILRYYYYVQDFFFLNAVFVHFPFINVSLKSWKCCCLLKCSLMPQKEYLLKKTSFQSFKSWSK